nr:integrase, catalytic region, zinc finger, CCHC-type, peptidase aspartic, catalytic [Tanacetum cinerariifolium]
MANLSEDIQCAGSVTQPPMLDRTDFASWQQCIRLYYRGKEFGHKGESIHDYYVRFAKLINDMRNIKMTVSRMQLNSKFVNNMLPEWGRFVIAVKLNRGLRDSNYDQLVEVQLDTGEFRTELGMLIWVKQDRLSATTATVRAHCKELHSTKATTELQILQRQDVDDAGLRERSGDLALHVDNVYQADDCDVFDSDVDEAPTAQTMFMANLSSANPVTDEAGPSYDSDILSEVRYHDHYQDAVCAHHEERAMHDSVQLNHVVDSHADYTSDSSMISYDQYVKDNE